MKKYKNTIISVIAYLVAIFIFVIYNYVIAAASKPINLAGLTLFILSVIIGIFYSNVSVRTNESAILGQILRIIGILALLLLFILYAFSLNINS